MHAYCCLLGHRYLTQIKSEGDEDDEGEEDAGEFTITAAHVRLIEDGAHRLMFLGMVRAVVAYIQLGDTTHPSTLLYITWLGCESKWYVKIEYALATRRTSGR